MIPSLTYYSDSPGSDIQVYPNPAVNRAFLFFNATEFGTATIRIFDVVGRCVGTIGPVSSILGLNKIDLDVSNLKKSMYKLSFELSSENQHIKEVRSIIVK
jgi:hypothetical protein